MPVELPPQRLVAILAIERAKGDQRRAATSGEEEPLAAARGTVARFRGRWIEGGGGSVLLEFPSAIEAVRCALALTRVADEGAPPIADDGMGAHLGEVRVEGDRLFGDAVNLALRLAALAKPGTVCVGERVADLVVGRVSRRFEDLGERRLKGVLEPVRVYRSAEPEAGEEDPLAAERRWPPDVAAD